MYQGQIGLKVKIPQSDSVLAHIVYIHTFTERTFLHTTGVDDRHSKHNIKEFYRNTQS